MARFSFSAAKSSATLRTASSSPTRATSPESHQPVTKYTTPSEPEDLEVVLADDLVLDLVEDLEVDFLGATSSSSVGATRTESILITERRYSSFPARELAFFLIKAVIPVRDMIAM